MFGHQNHPQLKKGLPPGRPEGADAAESKGIALRAGLGLVMNHSVE